MLILILSKDLKLRFLSPDATASFQPHPAHLGQPLEAAVGLMAVDPGLSLDCRTVLRGGTTVVREVSLLAGDVYLRRIMLRAEGDEQDEELVINYQPSMSAQTSELTQVRKHLADALDAVQDPLAYYDKYDCLVHYNQAYARLHGNSEGEISAGMHFEKILHRGLRNGLIGINNARHEQWLREGLAQRKNQTFEEEMRLCDGRWFRVTERLTAGGSRVHMLVDITDLKTAKVALQQVIYGSHAATWTVNLETGESHVNDRWAEMLGLDKQIANSLGFKGWRSLVHPDDVTDAEAGFLQCMEACATVFEVEYRLRHRLGHWVWVMGRGGVSDQHADGRPHKISGVLLDISRQKRLETELAMQSAAIAATEDGITITDEAGDIIYTNPSHTKMFGYYDPAALFGRPWHSLYTSQEAARLGAEAFPALRERGYWTGQADALRADGSTFVQELSLTEMADGKIICVNRDVSARNAIYRERAQIRDRIELAQRQEIVNLLAAGLTHDLSNLIATISYVSDPALEVSGISLAQSLTNIHATARQAVSLLEPIRSLGTGKRDVEDTDLGELLNEAVGVLKLGASHNLKITLDLPDEPIIASVEPLRLMQVLINIALNGRDALGDGKQEIRLSLSCSDTIPHAADIEVGDIPEKPHALFRISDTGTGIPPEVRSRLWEPHFTTKGSMGTGLGLPVIAQIVRDIGGAIALKTALGVGSTFYVAWPLTYQSLLARQYV